ncbi:MAG: pirin family protein [Candidatus Promineofilum sp.]|nr:pirin family protein [Promineifilum sp.]
MRQTDPFSSLIVGLDAPADLQHYPAHTFPTIHPVHWLTSHFAVGGFSPMRRLSGMLTAHMTQIEPGNGFAWHPHRGLEIYTYVIDGEIYHEDTTGGRGVISAGEVQRMFSGHYIEHQEMNRSDRPVRVIQIWFAVEPDHMGIEPHYEQIKLDDMPALRVGDGVTRNIIGPEGATDAHVTARLTSTVVPPGGQAPLEPPREGEQLFLYVVDGHGRLTTNDDEQALGLYDVALATPRTDAAKLSAGDEPLTYLSFYLPPFYEGGNA